MKLPNTSILLCILSALYSRGIAQHNVSFTSDQFGNGKTSSQYALGPWGMNLTEYNSHFMGQEPNVTTYLWIDGPNASYAYPGTATPDSLYPWILSVAVVAGIPAANTSSSVSPENKSKFFTGSRVKFQVPTMTANYSGNHSTLSPAYKDWDLCLFTWDFSSIYNISYPDKFREDDGNCTSIVSEQCVRDMENAATDNYKSRQCQCPNVSKLPSCDQGSLFAKLGCAARTFNATDVQKWKYGEYPLVTYGGGFHDKWNVTAYNETGSLTWPVMVLWGGWPEEPYHGGSQLVPVNNTAKLTCVRPMKGPVGEGNTPGIPSGAVRANVALGLSWLIVGLSSFVVLL